MDDDTDRVALVCVRDSRRFGLQVLLRRDTAVGDDEALRLSFPGGRVEEDDHAATTLERCCGMAGDEARRALGHVVTPTEALGYWVAGARALLNVTGFLFTVKGDQGAPVQRTLSARERRLLGGDALALASCLTRHDLYCDLSRLRCFSRWTDPHSHTAQGFFLVRIPDNARVAGGVWYATDKILVGWCNQEVHLDFPTFASLRILADFSSCDVLFSEYPPR